MQEGLQQTTPRQSSKTSDIDELLNHLLDARRPAALTQQGVSCVSNLYAHLSFGEDLYDITNGNAITISQLCRRSQYPQAIKLAMCPGRAISATEGKLL